MTSQHNSERTLANKPTWATEIVKRYGDFTSFSNRFSYARMNAITAAPSICFRADSPSLTRIDVTYGKGSAATWLYEALQATFLFLGVDNTKFRKEQVFDLAQTITNNYGMLKAAEIMLFLSRFKAGMYGRFYGGDSYALVVTTALQQFIEERAVFYDKIEREETNRRLLEDKKDAITFEEYKRRKEARGEKVSDALEAIFGTKKEE